MKKGKKITILGAGNVGATIAYTLAADGMASEILLIDINENKAKGEALDIFQGTPFCAPVNIHAGGYEDAFQSDVVVVTVGLARKPGQTRIDLAQANVDIIKMVMPQITKYAPDAVYVVVSNPVDIITYAILKNTNLSERQVFGSGTMLDSARLRSSLAEHVGPVSYTHLAVVSLVPFRGRGRLSFSRLPALYRNCPICPIADNRGGHAPPLPLAAF